MNEDGDLSLDEIMRTLPPTSSARQEYEELLRRERVLDALYAGGVDNWEWYEASLEDHLDE